MNEISVITNFSKDVIQQETIFESEGLRESVIRSVANLQDEGVKSALIALGWTPPDQPNTAEPFAYLCKQKSVHTEWFDHEPIVPGSVRHNIRKDSEDWELLPLYRLPVNNFLDESAPLKFKHHPEPETCNEYSIWRKGACIGHIYKFDDEFKALLYDNDELSESELRVTADKLRQINLEACCCELEAE
ncbi:MAG: hypothetical protein MJA28_06240 [Gammaproteobacteria bacterium]|nr:hypothetical protein [Gammaproteobacteria bacterium]